MQIAKAKSKQQHFKTRLITRFTPLPNLRGGEGHRTGSRVECRVWHAKLYAPAANLPLRNFDYLNPFF
jgi:hypothetical protein